MKLIGTVRNAQTSTQNRENSYLSYEFGSKHFDDITYTQPEIVHLNLKLSQTYCFTNLTWGLLIFRWLTMCKLRELCLQGETNLRGLTTSKFWHEGKSMTNVMGTRGRWYSAALFNFVTVIEFCLTRQPPNTPVHHETVRILGRNKPNKDVAHGTTFEPLLGLPGGRWENTDDQGDSWRGSWTSQHVDK